MTDETTYRFAVWGMAEKTYTVDAFDETAAREQVVEEAEWDFDRIEDINRELPEQVE